jgi:diadenosine tetraphosphatase ApaH/serine/threonine PP2A family protein phosphatase
MRVAVVSDIHGNLHALDAVVSAVDELAPDELWCLGDIVGYGPSPNECCRTIRERAAVCLCGNHDLGVLGAIDLAEFSDDAAAAAHWTRQRLDEDARSFLSTLEPQGRASGLELYHASPVDPVWEYVLTEEAAQAALDATEAPAVLVGHSHVALALARRDGAVSGGVARAGDGVDFSAQRFLLNPGSVGQPRDGDPRAAFLLLDTEARFAEFHRVPYEIERTQAEIREAGLPAILADRLEHGQ